MSCFFHHLNHGPLGSKRELVCKQDPHHPTLNLRPANLRAGQGLKASRVHSTVSSTNLPNLRMRPRAAQRKGQGYLSHMVVADSERAALEARVRQSCAALPGDEWRSVPPDSLIGAAPACMELSRTLHFSSLSRMLRRLVFLMQ